MTSPPVRLECPRDRWRLEPDGDGLACPEGHRYPIVDGVPVILLEDARPTHAVCRVSLQESEGPWPSTRDAVGIVRAGIAATCGKLYRPLIGRIPPYPIPKLRLPPGQGQLFLDAGCSWGRWCIAAARQGYRPVGLDPSLEAIRAAGRVAEELGVEAFYVVGDARHLPFPDASFDVAFSYSVFQHFARADAVASFAEIARVLRPGGTSLVQMANVWGARNLVNQARARRFREPRALFDVRYWGPRELQRVLEQVVGPTQLEADGFFTLNPQPADLELLPRRYQAVVRASEALRRTSRHVRLLTYCADSLYARSRRRATRTG